MKLEGFMDQTSKGLIYNDAYFTGWNKAGKRLKRRELRNRICFIEWSLEQPSGDSVGTDKKQEDTEEVVGR